MRKRFVAAIMVITLVSTSMAVLAQSKVAVNSTEVIQGLKDMMSPSGKFATVEMADGTSFSTVPTTGIGDVVGPVSSENNRVVFFDGLTGKLIRDSGILLSGSNTGDNATNSQYSSLVSNATHTGDATGATALTVVGVNGTLMSGLATGIIKNTTTTGVPSIAVAGDFPTLNQNTTGTAENVTGIVAIVNGGSGTTTATGTGSNVLSDSPVFSTKITTPAIVTSSGALEITPASGSGVNISLSTTGDFTINTNDVVVDTSSGYFGIGIMPTEALHVYKGTQTGAIKVLVQNDNSQASDGSAYAMIDALTNGGSRVQMGSYGTNYSNSDFAGFGKVVGYLNGLIVGAYEAGGNIKFWTGGSNGSYERMRLTDTGLVVGSTTCTSKLEVWNGGFRISDDDISHGITDWLPDKNFIQIRAYSDTAGGANFIGISDTDLMGVVIQGIVGTSTPTVSSMRFIGQKKSGIAVQAMGAAETVFNFQNYGTDLLSILGNGTIILYGVPRFNGTNSTGAGTALLGTNCPAVTVSAPYTWISIITADGSTAYMPAFK